MVFPEITANYGFGHVVDFVDYAHNSMDISQTQNRPSNDFFDTSPSEFFNPN